MAFFGLKSSKKVEEEKRLAEEAAAAQAEQNNLNNLSNLSKGSQVNFVIPYFDVFDPRFSDCGVPVSVNGTIVYCIDNLDLFQQVNCKEDYSDETFNNKLKGQVSKFVKSVIINAPSEVPISVLQLERKILEISNHVQQLVAPQVERLFGVTIRSIDIISINIDKDSRGYRELKSLTFDIEKENKIAQHNAEMSNLNLQNSLNQDLLKMQSSLKLDAMKRQQELNLSDKEELQTTQHENQRETMRIQRDEMQRASRLQTEQTFLGAHQANLNAGIINNATDNGLNAFSQQQTPGTNFGQSPLFSGVPQMPGMAGAMSQMPGTKASTPQVQYMVGVNEQQAGPFDWSQLQQLVNQGQLTQQTYVWKQGMPQWDFAGNVQELEPLFMGTIPQIPPQMPRQ